MTGSRYEDAAIIGFTMRNNIRWHDDEELKEPQGSCGYYQANEEHWEDKNDQEQDKAESRSLCCDLQGQRQEGDQEQQQQSIYVDYSAIPPTDKDRDSFNSKLKYYNKGNDTGTASTTFTFGNKQPKEEEDDLTRTIAALLTKEETSTDSDTFTSFEQQEQAAILALTGDEDSVTICSNTPFLEDFCPSPFPQKGEEHKDDIDDYLRSESESESNGHNNHPPCQVEEALDPKIFKRKGRGNSVKNNKVPSNNDGRFGFIGFMGTNFPARLHDLISKPSFLTGTNGGDEDAAAAGESDRISNTIAWLPHGRSWAVLDEKKFMESVATTHFNITHYKSFTRQVTAWGFRRVTTGPDAGSYYHELFIKDMPHLTKFMKRDGTNKSYRNSLSAHSCKEIEVDDENNPNFHAISKKYPIPNYYMNVKVNVNMNMEMEMDIVPAHKNDAGRGNKAGNSKEQDKKSRKSIPRRPREARIDRRRSSWPFVTNIQHQHQPKPQEHLSAEVEEDEEFGLFPQRKKSKGDGALSPPRWSEIRQEEVKNYQNSFFPSVFQPQEETIQEVLEYPKKRKHSKARRRNSEMGIFSYDPTQYHSQHSKARRRNSEMGTFSYDPAQYHSPHTSTYPLVQEVVNEIEVAEPEKHNIVVDGDDKVLKNFLGKLFIDKKFLENFGI